MALMRILEADSGRILIDGINIAELGLFDLRNKITIIPQDSYLFNGSLRTNLDPLGKYSDNEIWNALERVKLKSSFESKGGLDLEVSESGDSLSVGEKQLLCMARAILKNTKIVVLDEATSSIDIITEEVVQKTIQEVFKNSTVITIAHRLNTIIHSDKILVLSFGEVAEYDSPENLLKNQSSLFYKLWEESSKHNLEQPSNQTWMLLRLDSAIDQQALLFVQC
eukprot:TRINITY_DN7326_c0_g1_i3.p1 TRINITY_DN7326_c0_g1~~TRINITY_DN7326_c0_g1_i3.p1  ORF type:complete len:224 (+),score=25.16 TRINITY_DN7326_c0_g1_i3:427-1098(+)